ncbi:hypothetical protein KFK09_025068 [Dendrobium nobile]|uniref:Integrase catalytic domain-containing protein n=1 Tax=Dendrobium nobile TaxID=94219 RepID=A0A8T3AGN9_DENNO|nr:hypothetical protein KFK09_025068 [Dendrobium nobile]
MAKSHKLPFSNRIQHNSSPFMLMHTDVWGSAPVSSLDHSRYYVIFNTRFCWLYLMNTKSETLTKFKQFTALVQNQFNTKIKTLRSDAGGEYTSNLFRSYLVAHGITQQFCCPHTPEQNGLAERKHRHLLDITRTLLLTANLPHSLWADALLTANYLINRLPSKAIQLQIPFQMLYQSPPSYGHLRVFGCQCFPHLRHHAPHKLSPRSTQCTFIRYSPSHKGYRCYDPLTHRTHISRHVIFNEHIFPFRTSTPNIPPNSSPGYVPPLTLLPTTIQPTSSTSQLAPSPSISNPPTDLLPSITPSSPATTQISSHFFSLTPTTHPPPPHPMLTRLKAGISKPKQILDLLASPTTLLTPTSFTQASKLAPWRAAIVDEIEALHKQGT